jgi:hypothetical protein
MTWRGVWDGEWDGAWFGDDAPPGSLSGVARVTFTASATLTATSTESRGFVGAIGPVLRDGGVRRRLPKPRIAPEWEQEHENDGVLIAAGIF